MREPSWLSWREATTRALYGPGGFYRSAEGPAGHFRTSVHASGLFARAVAVLADRCRVRRVVDLGAGRGELLTALHAVDPGLDLLGVDVVARPSGLPPGVSWARALPDRIADALVIANEWLDDVPCEVVTAVDGRWRLVLVDPRSGVERLGGDPSAADRAWLDTWWPVPALPAEPDAGWSAVSDGGWTASPCGGWRAEVGRSRDEAWADVVRRMDRSVAVAIDYAHTRAERARGAFPGGTLAGYRRGRAVPPVPDGSCDVTAHVALDSCAAVGLSAGATASLLTTQRSVLRDLGVAADRPPLAQASGDPLGYVAGLASAGEAAELLARGGLGDFGWLVQAVGRPLPVRPPGDRLDEA